MKSILVNIARLNLCRSMWHRWHTKYSDKECRDAFVEAMNAQALEWGMTKTRWINPSGLGEDGLYSQSTANDLAIMAMRVFGSQLMPKYFGHNPYVLHIKKPYLIPGHRYRDKAIYSTTRIETIGDNYPIVGAKTGSGDGFQTLVMVCKIADNIVSGAIMNAKDEQGRFDAMDELMRLGDKILHGEKNAIECPIVNAKNACLYARDDNGNMKCIYAQNANESSAPMSTTKVMTLALVCKFEKEVNKMVYITPYDTKGVGDDSLHEWDKLAIIDLINVMMRESSNVAANALACIVGEKILLTHKV